MKNLFILITLLLVQNIHSSNLNVANKTVAVITEEQKIEKLIQYIENSDAIFIRNGEEFNAKDAAEHLRMKRKKAGKKVKTAKDFIDFVASKSYMSGEAYKMKFKNGSIINARDMLYNELRKIEKQNT
ncbi:MAG: DUF5329 family protein [Bacteroidota bacterium]|jgi:hypothetical protein